MFKSNKHGQSLVEYAILLAVIIAALLIMQVFIKRGYQGGLKDSADKMGEQFSAGGTTIQQKRSLISDQTITEEVGTGNAIANFLPKGTVLEKTIDKGVYSYTDRSGGNQTAETKTATDAASKEKTRLSEYDTTEVTNITPEKFPQGF